MYNLFEVYCILQHVSNVYINYQGDTIEFYAFS